MTYEEFIKRYSFNTETDLLGEGGFGIVFKAYDTVLDRYVAIKQSRVDKKYENFSLQNEVNLAKSLPLHVNIAHYEDCHRLNIPMMGTYDFGVLQYYKEGNLSKLRKTGKINAKNLNGILEGILNGLHHLHSHKIIHRDIKPGNILIAKRGEEYIPKITDFGISKQGASTDNSFISNSLAGGTYSYAAPEQLKGESKMRRNADLWSFGVIVYQLMTNKLPFEPTTLDTSSEAARNEVTTMILSGHLPENIETITPPHKELVKRCMVVDKMARVQTAQELIQILNGQETPKTKTEPKTPRAEHKTQIETNKGEPEQEENDDFSDSNEFETFVEKKPKPKQPSPTPNIKKEQPKKKKKNKVLLPMIIGFVAIIIAMGVYFSLPSESSDWRNAQTQNTISSYGSFTDKRDGKTYKTIKIGSQTWMAENLNYKTADSWWYGNKITNGDTYGRLYTWDAALTACPKGWHLPSDEEWKTMEKALGMSQSEADKSDYRGTDEGKKMKSTSGWSGWFDNGNGTNSSGFNALPGGFRYSNGSFNYLGHNGYWWSSSETSGTLAWGQYLRYDDGLVGRGNGRKTHGFSVRCLKD